MKSLKLVTREEWDEREARGCPVSGAAVKYVVITYETPSLKCHNHEQCVTAMRRLYEYYVTEKGMSDIPFNFLIGHDGAVYEARGWKFQPSKSIRHFSEHHGNRVDFAFIGDYTIEEYPHGMMDACLDIIGIGIEKGYVETYFEILDYRDEDRLIEAAANEKKNRPWENWQVQELARRVFHKKMDFEESNRKMRYLIPRENRPTNDMCVIL